MECTEKKEQRKYVLDNDEWCALVVTVLGLNQVDDWTTIATENMNRCESGPVTIVIERIIT